MTAQTLRIAGRPPCAVSYAKTRGVTRERRRAEVVHMARLRRRADADVAATLARHADSTHPLVTEAYADAWVSAMEAAVDGPGAARWLAVRSGEAEPALPPTDPLRAADAHFLALERGR
jgi:hypothetical protein